MSINVHERLNGNRVSVIQDPGRERAAIEFRMLRSALRTALTVALAVVSVSLAAQTTTGSVAVYDIVIRNGRVLDGMGNPWIRADVAIKDGRFAAIGRIEGKGTQ